MHLARVGGLGLVVERGSLLHADLARGRVDVEVVRRLAGERVGVGHLPAFVRRPNHRSAHRRTGRGVLGHVSGRVRHAGDVPALGGIPAVGVARAVGNRRGTRVDGPCPELDGIALDVGVDADIAVRHAAIVR